MCRLRPEACRGGTLPKNREGMLGQNEWHKRRLHGGKRGGCWHHWTQAVRLEQDGEWGEEGRAKGVLQSSCPLGHNKQFRFSSECKGKARTHVAQSMTWSYLFTRLLWCLGGEWVVERKREGRGLGRGGGRGACSGHRLEVEPTGPTGALDTGHKRGGDTWFLSWEVDLIILSFAETAMIEGEIGGGGV